MEAVGNSKSSKSSKNSSELFCCNLCDYKCNRKYNLDKHLLTLKHNLTTSGNDLEMFGNSKSSKFYSNKYICSNCDKNFDTNAGLWKHKKNCNNTKTKIIEEENKYEFNKDILLEILKKNNEFQMEMQKQMFDFMNDKIGNNSYNTINNNCNNKTFNLQVFLNETCKDAMNISEFVESINLQVSDLENVGKVGYIEGISNIIIKNLKALDVEKRPVHCTDQKREVIYVKEDIIWEKEDETNKKLRKAIRLVAHKNICMLKAFREKYPDCEEYDSKKSSQYNKLVIEAMGGKGDNDYEKNTKIIKKIAKVVGIDKN